jgi:hypothetical protein
MIMPKQQGWEAGRGREKGKVGREGRMNGFLICYIVLTSDVKMLPEMKHGLLIL